MTWLNRVLRLALCCALSLAAAQACGPDFSPDIFVRPNRPDLPKQYVQGSLGLLQPSFPRADLLVAYRYLSGGTLDEAEQKGWAPTYSEFEQDAPRAAVTGDSAASTPKTPVALWMQARGAFPQASAGTISQQRPIKIQLASGSEYNDSFLNCADDAFRTATATLADRAARWGSGSAALADWLRGQDAVFANCSGGSVAPAPAAQASPALLVSDRAYQAAAAHFYSLALPAATQEFLAIGRDKASPWQPIAGYLAARAMVRAAFLAQPVRSADTTDAAYDPALMRAAATQLRGYLAANPPAPLRQAGEAQLAMIRIRVEPAQRARELAGLVGGPGHDANYAQDLKDLLWFIDEKTPEGLRAQPEQGEEVPDAAHPGSLRAETEAEASRKAAARRQSVEQAIVPVRALAAAIDWTLTMQSLEPAAAAHALEQWRETHAVAWLVAALALAPEGAPPDLLTAAAAVPVTSPAWQTVTYHRARLLLAAGRAGEARSVVAAALPRIEQFAAAERQPSSVNAFRGLAMLAAPTLADFLQFAPRTMLLAESEEASSVDECQETMKEPRRHYDCTAQVAPEQMDADAAQILNGQAPLPVWLAAVQSSALSAQLRGAIGIAGWTRAILLHNSAQADAFVPLLPAALRTQAGSGAGLQQWMTLARNPGLTPYLNGGTQRAYSYDFVESYRDNWCYRAPDVAQNLMAAPIAAAFEDSREKQQGAEEARLLAPMRSVGLGEQIVRAVDASPADPHAPEALFLVLRMIRYGCVEAASASGGVSPVGGFAQVYPGISYSQESIQLLQLKQKASRLLRQHYALSPWTKKAAPYAG